MKSAKDVLKAIKENDVKYVDFRFTDPRGKWQHVTFDVGMIDEDIFAEGTMFDGSSIAGWKAINESDMLLMPDPTTATMDPFFSAATMVINCDVLEPATGEPYGRDPRGIAKKAEAYLKSTGIGDTVYVGPEAEFFVFDDVKIAADPYHTSATASPPRVATSRSRRRIRRRICAARCWLRCSPWASPSRSTITRSPRPSMSSA